MNNTVGTIVECIIGYKQNEGHGSSWHFGSYEGALKYCKEEAAKGTVAWYSIEELFLAPCKEDDPGGKLYKTLGRNIYEDVN